MPKKAVLGLLVLLFAATLPAAPKFDPSDGWIQLFDGQSLAGWKPMDSEKRYEWLVADKVGLDPANPKKLLFELLSQGADSGVMVNGSGTRDVVNIVTEGEYGDVELYLEFMVPEASNSGVYMQGLYEIQILDSYGKKAKELKFSDCGGIYARYIDKQVVGGNAPRLNASRPPGEWQSFHIWFRAPRFDGTGKKIENARFVKIAHNGKTLHENIDLPGPTRAHMNRAESAKGPLMLQGDHGPVAFRKIYVRELHSSKP